jgi:hypothetical protein
MAPSLTGRQAKHGMTGISRAFCRPGPGAGIATGLQAGACLTVEAAKEKGLITAEQVEEIFAAAAETMKVEADIGADTDFADSDAECREVVAKLKQAAAQRE